VWRKLTLTWVPVLDRFFGTKLWRGVDSARWAVYAGHHDPFWMQLKSVAEAGRLCGLWTVAWDQDIVGQYCPTMYCPTMHKKKFHVNMEKASHAHMDFGTCGEREVYVFLSCTDGACCGPWRRSSLDYHRVQITCVDTRCVDFSCTLHMCTPCGLVCGYAFLVVVAAAPKSSGGGCQDGIALTSLPPLRTRRQTQLKDGADDFIMEGNCVTFYRMV
jgi:hypothetical protein